MKTNAIRTWTRAGRSPRFSLVRAVIGAVLCLLPLTVLDSHAAHWPSWRGPAGDGISTETNLPIRWSKAENVRWRAPLPEPGNSTPVLWGDRVFVTQNIGDQRSLLCLDRRNGRELWRAGVKVSIDERTHETNPYASASPVVDGERIICWFGSGGLVAYDFQGQELWRRDLGRHDHQFGYGGSPVLHGDLCFLNFGPGQREFVVAVNKVSGAEIWRVESPTPGASDIYGMWSTPFLARANGRDELLIGLRDYFAALDPETGREWWRCEGLGMQAKSSPVAGEGIAVFAGDLRSAEVAVKLGGTGDVTETHRLWRKFPAKRRVGTGVIHDGHIYNVQNNGIFDCVHLRTGEVIWEERVPGSGTNHAIWSSPVLVNGLLYAINQNGDTLIVRAERKFELVAVNPLGEPSNSSVAISNGHLFIRTHEALWCIGATDEKQNAPLR